jgi:short-subunit dehydrogenase
MSNKVAIVTGASSGIGEATATRLDGLGFTVYAAARRLERMKPLADVGIRTVAVDVTDDVSLIAFVDRVIAESGRIDVLVNNAGYGSYGALEDVPMSEARRQFDVNIFALARLTQLVLPHMRAQHNGYVVNISSIGGKVTEPLGGWYHATKFAVEGLSDSIRMELKPHGVKVVLIEPGSIATEWGGIAAESVLEASGHGAYAKQAEAVARVLAPKPGRGPGGSSPDGVAKAIAKAVTSRRPRTRYAVGLGGKPITYGRRVLSDRALDRLISWLYRPAK